MTASAVQRHAASHLPASLAKAQTAAEQVQADDLLSRVKLLESEAWALLRVAKAKAEQPDASPATLSAASGLVGRVTDVLTLFGRVSGELVEKHLHGHLHRHEAEPTLPPAAVLQLAAEEVGERAHELDQATRRALVAALLAPPPENVQTLSTIGEGTPENVRLLEVVQ